jgi:predicted permease
MTWLERARQDFAYAARRLRRSSGFTLGAVAVLSLGIGVNLAEFHIFNAVLFPKISVRDVDSLRRLTRRGKPGNPGGIPYAAVSFYREHNTVLSAIVTETFGGTVSFDDDPRSLFPTFVSGNYFPELGALPAYGRLLDENDTKAGAPAVVVLGYGFWQRQFGSDPGVVGRVIHLNGRLAQIVGVTAYDFAGLRTNPSSLWLPVTLHPYLIQGSNLLNDFSRGNTNLYGSLKPGVSNPMVEQQLTSLTSELQKLHPENFKPGDWIQSDLLNALPIGARETAAAAPFILLILLILLSACANLGNMLLARGLAREREIEIRIAVGAGRWRVIRQLMTENLLLAVIGTIAGLLVGRLTARLLLYILEAPQFIRIETDWRILLVGAILTFFSALVFGLTPAIQTVRRGPKVTRARQVLVAVQVAASCVLLIMGSLLTRGILRTLTVEVKFDYAHMMVVDPEFYARDVKPSAARQTLEDFTSRLQQLPGVDGVTAATVAPLGGRAQIERVPHSPPLYVNGVPASYFSVMRIPIVRGRVFTPSDQDAVIVSESASRALWPNQEPLGKICDFAKRKWTVVGVAGDSGASTAAGGDSVEVYTPLGDDNMRSAVLIVVAKSDPAPLVSAARSAVTTPGMASSAWLMQTRMNQRSDGVRRAITIIGSLGAVATLLAAIGIFGLVSFAVSQRTREIGVRMALGARSLDILRAVLSQYATPVGIGVVAGVGLAIAFCQILRNQIRGFDFVDPLSYAAGVLLFGAIAFAAALVPATRALRIDPSSALRFE